MCVRLEVDFDSADESKIEGADITGCDGVSRLTEGPSQ